MKRKFLSIIVGACALIGSNAAMANEIATIVHLENNCKFYVSKSSSGFHVMGAINHNPPAKDTKIIGNFNKTGFQDMQVGEAKTTTYMELSFVKLASFEEAKKELEFKCMESR